MHCNVNMSLISSFLLDKKYSNMTHIPDIILKSSSNVTIATMKEFRQPYWTLIFKLLYNLWYHCDLCEYKANHKCNITKHVQIKHEGLVFGCDDCDNKSTSNARVAVHEESYYKGIR